jgi:hypothetical protein
MAGCAVPASARGIQPVNAKGNYTSQQFPGLPTNMIGNEQANRARLMRDSIILDVITEGGRVVRSGDEKKEPERPLKRRPAPSAMMY